MRLLVLSTILFFNSISLLAQDYVEITGIVLRADSLVPINGAVIYNKNSFLGTLTNSKGTFKMRVKYGDTLTVSHLGFRSETLIINSSEYLDPTARLRITLNIITYELPTIDIRRFRLRDRSREVPFSLLRKDNITNPYKLPYDFEPFYYMPNLGTLGMPSYGFILPDFKEINRQAQREKIAALEQKERKKNIIFYKYNRRLVNQLTGLTGNELENFMNYCKPNEKEILEASEYELTYIILTCYEKFRIDND